LIEGRGPIRLAWVGQHLNEHIVTKPVRIGMGAVKVNIGSARTVKTVGEFVAGGVRKSAAGVWHARRIAAEAGLSWSALCHKRIRDQPLVRLVKKCNLHLVSESRSKSWPGFGIRVERRRTPSGVPTAILTHVFFANIWN